MSQNTNGRTRWAKRYAVAFACVLAAFSVRYLLTPVLGEELPFMMFIAAALVAAWSGGALTGMVALMLGLLLGLLAASKQIHPPD